MVRLPFIFGLALFTAGLAVAAADDDPRINRALALQKAMDQARDHMTGGRVAEAVATLEAQILRVDGDERYLAMMRQTYIEYWKELKRKGDSSTRLDHVRRQLRILDPNLNPENIDVALDMPRPAPKMVADEPPPRKKAAGNAPVVRAQNDDDPFQQVPLDRMPPGVARPRKAATKPVEKLPDGWQALDAQNFRVLFRDNQTQADQAAKLAERARVVAFETWAGPATVDWGPKCDLWLHGGAESYVAATRQPAESPGHASVGLREGQVHSRRIDLRLDVAGWEESTLPREISYVVLTDLFPEQAPPAWAQVGMTALSEAPARVARCRRAAAGMTQSKSLPAARDLLPANGYPTAEKITPFYVASVTLVEYLVKLKGAKAFTLYLREAPRRGYEEALQRHYGIRDASDLQDRWLKFTTQGQ